MPTIQRFPTATVTMYAGDHLPPHFHVRMNDGREVLVVIDGLTVLRGSVAVREMADAMAWAKANRVALLAKWKELNP